MRTLIFMIFALAAVFLPVFVASAHEEDKAVVVHMTPSGFEPSDFEISIGTKVIFENTDTRSRWPASDIHPTHTIYSEFDPKRAIAPGESWEFIFGKEGVWRFHDHLFPRLGGKITIVAGIVSVSTSTPEIQKKSIFMRFFENLASIWDKIKSAFKKQPAEAPKVLFDETIEINEAAKEIFNDDAALAFYIKKFGPAKTTEQLHKLSAEFGDCHQQAHDAGNISYEIFKEKAFQLCRAECHSGCYHGATEAFFEEHGTANLESNLAIICSSELNSFFSHQCVHGIGHGLMAWTNYELNEALESCDLLPERQDSCWTGVFMENIVGGLADESSAHYTRFLSDDPHFPCSMVADKYKNSCYFLQTSQMIKLFRGDFSMVVKACNDAPIPYQRACFESMGRDVGGRFRGNTGRAITECRYAPEGNSRVYCLSGAVQDFFWDSSGQDSALRFCATLSVKEEKDSCYATIFGRAAQVLPDRASLEKFCAKTEVNYFRTCQQMTNL